jgi:1-acyl-sn-glycerol-3-phosphate acyltransferase
MTLLYRVTGRGLARFCFSNLGRLEVTGREAVPPYGPLIVVSNHLSYTDSPLLVASIPRPLYFICKGGPFVNPMSKYVLERFHVAPFDRSRLRVDAARLMLRMLAEDRAVVVFPEGHRSPDHTMKAGMLGVVYLALKSQAPILPVGLTGTEKIRGWRMPLPLCRLSANIGQPFTLPLLEGRPSREVMASLLDLIMVRIADLLPAQYRGAYSRSGLSQPRAAAGSSARADKEGPGAESH